MKARDLPVIVFAVLVAIIAAWLVGKATLAIAPDWCGHTAALTFAATILLADRVWENWR